MCLLCSIGVAAQKLTATGQVLDSGGEPIIGASVIEAGTTNGTITDLDGNFTLNVNENARLQISYIGYETQTINLKGQKFPLRIRMKDDAQTLEEVVVTGYGGKQLRSKVRTPLPK